MKTLKLLSLFALAFVFSHCGTTEPTTTTSTRSVIDAAHILDSVQDKFYALAQANLSASAEGVLVMTANWVQTLPGVKKATWLDSTYIDIRMNSGLRTTFMINRIDKDSISRSRGGNPRRTKLIPKAGGNMTPAVKANNVIENKKVLLFEPFGACGKGNFYTQAELDAFVSRLKNSDKELEVTLKQCGECTVKLIESFGNYGLVFIETHGLPDGFLSGNLLFSVQNFDTTDEQIKTQVDKDLGSGGFEKLRSGDFRLSKLSNIFDIINWQQYLENSKTAYTGYKIIVNSSFIESIPELTNTVVFGNMCYSGWSVPGSIQNPDASEYTVDEPIQKAFMNRNPICYYAYAYDDGTSATVGNGFAEIMMDTMIRALVVDGDSTGKAYLSFSGKEFIGAQFGGGDSPNLPLKQFGAEDYSYDDCIEEFTDERDGENYKAVCIGKQTWMAENLRYSAPGSVEYDNSSINGDTYGRLYDWATLMQGASESTTNPSKVQGVCPKGWHVPSKAEWLQLSVAINYVGGDLKDTKLWLPPNTGATNLHKFNALGGGIYELPGFGFHKLNEYGFWWTTQSENGASTKRVLFLLAHNTTELYRTEGNQDVKASCRCVKD